MEQIVKVNVKWLWLRYEWGQKGGWMMMITDSNHGIVIYLYPGGVRREMKIIVCNRH